MDSRPNTHRQTAVVLPDGSVNLDHVPFPPGQAVEVTVQAKPDVLPFADQSLRGQLLCYDRPFDPVAEEDWEVLQ